jgi:hypothetical protein
MMYLRIHQEFATTVTTTENFPKPYHKNVFMGTSCSAPQSEARSPRLSAQTNALPQFGSSDVHLPQAGAPAKPKQLKKEESIFIYDLDFAAAEFEDIKAAIRQMQLPSKNKYITEVAQFEKQWFDGEESYDEKQQARFDKWSSTLQKLFNQQAKAYRKANGVEEAEEEADNEEADEEAGNEEETVAEPVEQEPEKEVVHTEEKPHVDIKKDDESKQKAPTEPKAPSTDRLAVAAEVIANLKKIPKNSKAYQEQSIGVWISSIQYSMDNYKKKQSKSNTTDLETQVSVGRLLYGKSTNAYVSVHPELDAIDTSSMFVDPDFPPSKWNIDNINGGAGKLMYAARRPCQLLPNAVFSPNNEFDFRDIDQGGVGDCYFIASISAINNKPHLIEKMIIDKDEKAGKYTFQFFVGRELVPTQVTIDDLLPVGLDGIPCGARSNIDNHYWVSLLEKAFAKCYGGYDVIGQGGTPSMTIVCMTGGTIFDKTAENPDKVFKELKDTIDTSVTCCYGCTESGAGQQIDKRGIVQMHVYSILNAVEVTTPENNKTYRLIQVRNPWGWAKWTGKFSDKDKAWTPALIKALNVEWLEASEGIFWMTPEDFVTEFQQVSGVNL